MISVTEIILIIVGFAAVIVGYVLPAGKGEGAVDPEEVEELVQDKLDKSLNDSVRRTIDGMARDAVDDAIDDNKLTISRISMDNMNEISEYAATVLDEIKKNHDEVVFMYDMLNDKHRNLTTTVSEMTRTEQLAKQTIRDAELTARDAKDAAATLDAATARVKAAALEQRTRVEQVYTPTPRQEEPKKEEKPAEESFSEGIIPGMTEIKPRETVIRPPEAAPDQILNHAAEILQNSEAAAALSQREALTEEQPEDDAPMTGIARASNTPNTAKAAPKRVSAPEPMSQNRQILEMHNAGKSNMVIARELGLGIGEVRLVIDLSKKQTGKA